MILIASCFYDCIVLHSEKKKKSCRYNKVYSIKQVNIIHSLIQIKPIPIIGGAVYYPCKLCVCTCVCVYSSVLKISVTFLLQSPITPTLAVRYLYTQ